MKKVEKTNCGQCSQVCKDEYVKNAGDHYCVGCWTARSDEEAERRALEGYKY